MNDLLGHVRTMMDPLVFVTPHAKLYYVWVLRLSNLQKQTKIT